MYLLKWHCVWQKPKPNAFPWALNCWNWAEKEQHINSIHLEAHFGKENMPIIWNSQRSLHKTNKYSKQPNRFGFMVVLNSSFFFIIEMSYKKQWNVYDESQFFFCVQICLRCRQEKVLKLVRSPIGCTHFLIKRSKRQKCVFIQSLCCCAIVLSKNNYASTSWIKAGSPLLSEMFGMWLISYKNRHFIGSHQ